MQQRATSHACLEDARDRDAGSISLVLAGLRRIINNETEDRGRLW